VTVIDGRRTTLRDALGELWQFRDLALLLTLRDIKVRYRTTAVGAAWALIQPLLTMAVLVVFATLFGVHGDRVPYPLFLISGLVPWTYFTHGLTQATHSIVSHEQLLAKVYFPRMVLPVAAVLGGVVDFLAAAVLVPAFMVYFGVLPSLAAVTLPLFVILAVATALALGLWLAVLNARYRDVGNMLPFVTQLLFFATPISYPMSAIPARFHLLAGLNPMTGVVEGFRWALFAARGESMPGAVWVSVAVTTVLLLGGGWFVLHQQDGLGDVI
jgi:lipopolysaccharide transport system permease protein